MLIQLEVVISYTGNEKELTILIYHIPAKMDKIVIKPF